MQQENENIPAGKFLLFRKKVLHMTQSEVAEKLGVSIAAVGNWEKRGSKPTGKLLWSMMKEFNLNPDWLFYDVGDPLLKHSLVDKKPTTERSEPKLTIDFGQLRMPASAILEHQPALERLSLEISELRSLIEHGGGK